MNKLCLLFWVLLLCGGFVCGWWVGQVVSPTHPPDTEYVTVVDTHFVKIPEVQFVIDSIFVETPNDSLKSLVTEQQDTILYLKYYMQKLLSEQQYSLVASDSSFVKLGKVSFTQKTKYDYGTELFDFMYTDVTVPVLVQYRPKTFFDYTNIAFGMTTNRTFFTTVSYKWYFVGYQTDNTFMLGMNANLGELCRLWQKK